MTELETMMRAKMYIDKLAKGVNPLTDAPLPDADTLNNVKLSRCLYYVSEVLQRVIDNGGEVVSVKKSGRKIPFEISQEKRDNFAYSDKPISVSEIAAKLNELADLTVCKKITHGDISTWLIEIGALKVIETYSGNKIKCPTDEGQTLGISTEERHSPHGDYTVVLYNKEAQKLIVDNVEEIMMLKAIAKGLSQKA